MLCSYLSLSPASHTYTLHIVPMPMMSIIRYATSWHLNSLLGLLPISLVRTSEASAKSCAAHHFPDIVPLISEGHFSISTNPTDYNVMELLHTWMASQSFVNACMVAVHSDNITTQADLYEVIP